MGWRVGVVRIEDVAIGFAVSLGVGLLFWPRGAASALLDDACRQYLVERSATQRASLTLLWAVEHLEVLRQLESHIAAHANAANASAQPREARLRFRLAA